MLGTRLYVIWYCVCCKVLFPELSRGESQRYLDQMKANLNASRVVSPHSGKGIVQSCESPSLNYHKTYTPSCGASVQHYRGSSHERTIPSYGAPLQTQGSLPGVSPFCGF